MGTMKNNWWKITTILLLFFVVIYSLITWLQPGIASVSNEELKTHNEKIIVTGYNTDFTTTNESFKIPQVYLFRQNSDEGFCVNNVKVIDATHLELNFDIPKGFTGLLDLSIYYSEDALVYPSAFRIVDNDGSGESESCPNSDDKTYSPVHKNAFPNQPILQESIRNLMFHVPMWFSMMLMFIISLVASIRYLRTNDNKFDRLASMAINVGLIFGLLGVCTGSLWARFTWGHWWVYEDPKLNGSALTVIIYLAYIILRNSIQEDQKRGRLSAVYNVFSFAMMIVFIWVVPRMVDSLHPGNGGNPAFSSYDLDSSLRMVFYPAVLGWMGLSIWILNIRIRMQKIKEYLDV